MADRTALVSGAGNGLGRAIALALAADGYRVVLAGRRPEPLWETAALLGADYRVATVDVADPA
ncbi:MAG TPA: SDR family NAD(P)-dependent oxidoreductase, partial [Jatrophihabitans sp.]|nr:SDR family NAD(P)-dependent oxidoreductase [Jatrophihabitans sp.]